VFDTRRYLFEQLHPLTGQWRLGIAKTSDVTPRTPKAFDEPAADGI
jgi:hypothetical protein